MTDGKSSNNVQEHEVKGVKVDRIEPINTSASEEKTIDERNIGFQVAGALFNGIRSGWGVSGHQRHY
jgi:hypothetical protein